MAIRYPYYGRDYDRDYDRDREYARGYRRDYSRDYDRGYGEERGRLNDLRPSIREERYERRDLDDRDREDRGWWDRTRDEVASWFGDDESDRRRRDERRGYGRDHESFEAVRAVDLMTRNVMCVRPDDRVEIAARMMADNDCGSLPVVNRSGRLIGMVTDRDMAMRLVSRGIDTRRATVDDCMTDEVFSCNVYDSLEKCMREMKRHQIRRLPIVDDRDRIVGIVSQGDLARHAGTHQGYGERRAVADTLYEISEPTGNPHR